MKNSTFRLGMFCVSLLLLTACATVSYMGDQLPATNDVVVFYDAKDVKKEYKVIGHIYASTTMDAEKVKGTIVTKAKAVGADAVIILGLVSNGTGKALQNIQQADAIKYTK